MKAIIIAAATALSFSTAAVAAPISCTTDVANNPRLPATTITLTEKAGQVDATLVTTGGLAQFITAPVTIPVQVTHIGPEVVKYTNSEKNFDLLIGFQPINGKVFGTLTRNFEGRALGESVVCAVAEDL